MAGKGVEVGKQGNREVWEVREVREVTKKVILLRLTCYIALNIPTRVVVKDIFYFVANFIKAMTCQNLFLG